MLFMVEFLFGEVGKERFGPLKNFCGKVVVCQIPDNINRKIIIFSMVYKTIGQISQVYVFN